jgi:hypothetical protein
MAPDKPDRPRRAARDEFEVAYYTKELGRPLQRKLLQRRLNELTDHTISAASHGDDPKMEIDSPLPREDRAG